MKVIYSLILGVLFMLSGCQTRESQIPRKVMIDDDGMILIGGKRTFILGSYHLAKGEQPFQELSKAGFNLVRDDFGHFFFIT